MSKDKTPYLHCLRTPSCKSYRLNCELTYDGLVSHPGRVNDSHMLCKTESGGKHLLYAPSMLYFMAQRRIKLILLHSKSYNKNLRHYLRKTTLLLVVSIVIGKERKRDWRLRDVILTLDKTGATTVPNLSALCLSLSTSVACKQIRMILYCKTKPVLMGVFQLFFLGWGLILAYHSKQNQIYM